MPGAGHKQHNDQRCLLDQHPANQSRQEIIGRLIFQSPQIATFDAALPAASRCLRTARPGRWEMEDRGWKMEGGRAAVPRRPIIIPAAQQRRPTVV